tara:strand:+ start:157 stop:333 length:177 start_codon:yes stop_codon:yes gene_type:complete
MDNLLRFLIGYMEDTHQRLVERKEKEVAAIVFKNMESLKKDLNDHIEFFPVFFPIDDK